MDLYVNSLNVIRPISSTSEVRQVELNLIPAFVETHRHCAHERFDTRCSLLIRGAEAAHLVFVVEHSYFKAEFFLQILNNHDKERQFDR